MATRQRPVWWPVGVPFPLLPTAVPSALYVLLKKKVADAETAYNAQQKTQEAIRAFGNRPQPMPATVPTMTPIPTPAPLPVQVPSTSSGTPPVLMPAMPVDDSGLPMVMLEDGSDAAGVSDEEGSRGGGSDTLGLLAAGVVALLFLANLRNRRG